MTLHVLCRTEALVAVDKPVGALSVPSRIGREDARPCVLYALSEQEGERLFPVHRLDEEVSGVLVFARTAEAHRRLCGLFESRAAKKTYEAWVEGAGLEGDTPGVQALEVRREHRLEDRLVRGKRRAFVAAHGKDALTIAREAGRVRFDGEERVRLLLEPRTGRSHQLRVQLALRGCPIVGDSLYGARAPFVEGGVALRAIRLALEDVVVEASGLSSLPGVAERLA